MPNTKVSKDGIPNYKNNGNYSAGNEELLPCFIKFYFGVKRKQERNKDGKKINKEIKKSHVAFLIFNSLKYLKGTHNIPKHSPSSFVRCL